MKTDKVDVVFYLEAFNRRSYALVRSFQSYYEKIERKIDFKIVHNVFKCGSGKCATEDCYADG